MSLGDMIRSLSLINRMYRCTGIQLHDYRSIDQQVRTKATVSFMSSYSR